MPERKNPPVIRVVVEFELVEPEPSKITKEMVNKTHDAIWELVDRAVDQKVWSSGSVVARHVRTTKVVK